MNKNTTSMPDLALSFFKIILLISVVLITAGAKSLPSAIEQADSPPADLPAKVFVTLRAAPVESVTPEGQPALLYHLRRVQQRVQVIVQQAQFLQDLRDQNIEFVVESQELVSANQIVLYVRMDAISTIHNHPAVLDARAEITLQPQVPPSVPFSTDVPPVEPRPPIDVP